MSRRGTLLNAKVDKRLTPIVPEVEESILEVSVRRDLPQDVFEDYLRQLLWAWIRVGYGRGWCDSAKEGASGDQDFAELGFKMRRRDERHT